MIKSDLFIDIFVLLFLAALCSILVIEQPQPTFLWIIPSLLLCCVVLRIAFRDSFKNIED